MTDCPLCHGPAEPALVAVDRNRAVGDEAFAYRRCRACGTLFLADVPADLGRYYPPSDYPLDAAQADETEAAKLALVRRFVSGGRLVEVGPGAGGFAAAAQRSGFDVTAVEMDEAACRHLRERLGIEAIRSDRPHVALATLAPPRVVVLWHVLEHLEDPWALVDAAAARLEPGGALVLAVPNPQAFQLRVLGSRWAHLDAPRHRFLIPAHTLVARVTEAGLEPLAVVGADRTGRDWNVFGWQHALLRADSGERRRRAAFYVGALTALALAPVERRGLRGATYTAIFRKDGAR
jgi:2-polyprenyl-3-methyl-5-hydroxy-6-metoxy-1,4-benzoquinol methylase